MHKKSLEASKKLNEVEMTKDIKDELRTESIATLRAKAHEHTVKVVGVTCDDPPICTGTTSVMTSKVGGALAVGAGYGLNQCGGILQET